MPNRSSAYNAASQVTATFGRWKSGQQAGWGFGKSQQRVDDSEREMGGLCQYVSNSGDRLRPR